MFLNSKVLSELYHFHIVPLQSGRFERVLLNRQASSWPPALAGVPQESILGSLFFLIYINDLSHNLSLTVKLFADDASFFSIVHDIDSSTKLLNDDLKTISEWAYQWKMSFNPVFLIDLVHLIEDYH